MNHPISVLCCLALAAPLVQAQGYPAKTVRIVNSYAAGGSIDIVARPLAQRLGEALGQTFIVDNRPGASGNIGGDTVAKSAPDGYTVLIASTAQVTINPHIFKKMPFDPARDLVPVTLLTQAPTALVIHPSVPVRTVKELIAFARTRPEQLTYSSAGSGSINHLTTAMFMLQTGTKLIHVPYKGGAPAFQDVASGQIHLMMASASAMMGFTKAGKTRALAVNSSRRLAELPEVPTMAEAGLPGFESSAGVGLMVPTGTPDAIIGRLHVESVKIMQTDQIRANLSRQGVEVIGSTPEGFGQLLRDESARWSRVIKEGDIRF